MKNSILFSAVICILLACNDSTSTKESTTSESKTPDIREEAVSYKIGDTTFNGFVTYDHNDATKRPAVLIVHEWWGITDFVHGRAKLLAEMGYVAMVVDMYGNGLTGPDPQAAQKLVTPFYENPGMARERLDAGLAKLLTYKEVDPARVAAIGYCFGGYVVLNAAKLGADLKGVVSFHGGLGGAAPKKELLKAKILVCHGANDNFVPQQEVDMFKKGMDSIGAVYTFKVYANATHAFTNPEATAKGKQFKLPVEYNAAADSASWNDMKAFFKEIL